MKHRINIILSFLLSMFPLWANAEREFTSGEGTVENPYVITTAEQLQRINEFPTAAFKLGGNIDLAEWITVNSPEQGWNELCRTTTFTGQFDGDGYAITGLWLNKPTVDNVGLFAQLGSGSIIRNLIIKTTKQGVVGNHRVAVLVGGTTQGASNITIEGCMVDGHVKGFQGCGAFIGWVPATLPLYLNNSYAIGSITITNINESEEQPQYAGGLIGYIWGKTELNINNCYAANEIYAENGVNVGGLIGVIGGSKSNNTWIYINNTVALNPQIQSNGTAIGRIYGGKSSPVVAKLGNVYALAEMKVLNKEGVAMEIIDDENGQNCKGIMWKELIKQETYETLLNWEFLNGDWVMSNAQYLLPIRGRNLRIVNQPNEMSEAFDFLVGRDYTTLTKIEVATKMKQVNDYYMARHQNPGSNDWVTSTYFIGCMNFYNLYPEECVLDYMNSWAEKNNWALGTNADQHGADGQVCGQTYIDLYKLDGTPNENKIKAIKACVDDLIANPSESIDDLWWVDSYFMVMPVFSKFGNMYNNESYFKQMHDMQKYSMERWNLYSETDHLWYRDSTQIKEKTLTPNGKPVYWSRGNGWVMAALALVLNDLPENNPYRSEYIQLLQDMAKALKTVQREDGFWNRSLADKAHLPGPETSGTALFTYGIAWGINHGILDRETYLPVVWNAWNGMVEVAIQENGLLGYVQGPGYKPESKYPLDENATYDYGVGAFLLAGSEVIKLASGQLPELGELPQAPEGEIINMNVTASASENSSRTPDKTLDRDFNTRWSAEGEQWIKYDLLEPKTVTAVELAFWDGHKRKFYFSIELSEDDENWIEVFNGESSGTTDSWETFPIAPHKARFVRINGRGNSKNQWNSILETRIQTDEEATDVQVYIDIVAERLMAYQRNLYGNVDPTELINTMREDGSWGNIDYNDRHSVDADGWQPNIHFDNMIRLAIAYNTLENPYYKNPNLLAKIVASLEFIHDWIGDPLVYSDKKNPNRRDLDNWWWTQLGDPQKMMVTLLFIKCDIPSADIKRYATFLIDRTGDSSYRGKNLAWAAEITLYKGCIENNYQLMYAGFSGFASILRLIDTKFPIAAGEKDGEGFQHDYSFHQHRRQLQTGSYGLSLIPDFTSSMQFAKDTPFDAAFTKENRSVFSKGVQEGYMLFSYRGTMDFGSKGRAVIGESGFDVETIREIKAADPDHADVYTEWEEHIANKGDFPLIGNKYFWNSNIMTHHGGQYYLSAKIPSVRNVGTECINQENLKGRNVPKGATNILTTGNEYYKIAPVWDWSRIPGTTAVLDASSTGLQDGYFYATNEFGGGVTDGKSGIIAYVDDKDDAKYKDGLVARKAYFFMGDLLLCLGTDITDSSTSPVVTSVNQCLRNGDIYYSDGKTGAILTGSMTAENISWVHHDNVGYIFPIPADITVQEKNQTGTWKEVNGTQSEDPITKNVFSIWINHGTNPNEATYQYIVAPCKAKEEMGELATKQPFDVIRNDKDAQVIYNKALNQFGVVCYTAGTVRLTEDLSIYVDKPVIFLLSIEERKYIFTVADPMYYDHVSPVVEMLVSEKLTGDNADANIGGTGTDLRIQLPKGQYTGSSVTMEYMAETGTDLTENIKTKAVSVYPNPVGEWLYVEGADAFEPVIIYDAVGNKVLETFDKCISVKGINKGFYFVKVKGTIAKIVKK